MCDYLCQLIQFTEGTLHRGFQRFLEKQTLDFAPEQEPELLQPGKTDHQTNHVLVFWRSIVHSEEQCEHSITDSYPTRDLLYLPSHTVSLIIYSFALNLTGLNQTSCRVSNLSASQQNVSSPLQHCIPFSAPLPK